MAEHRDRDEPIKLPGNDPAATLKALLAVEPDAPEADSPKDDDEPADAVE